MSFTLSQAGMVMHWRKAGGRHAKKNMFVNGLGATVTGITVIVVMIAKFTEGAWITLLMIPGVLLLMGLVRRHYHQVAMEVATPFTLEQEDPRRPIVVVPLEDWNVIAQRALQFAMTMSEEVQVLHVESETVTDSLRRQWEEWEKDGHPHAGKTAPKLVVLPCPYREVIKPIINYIIKIEKENPDRQVAVVISELVEQSFFQRLLHNQRAHVLTSLLTRNGDQRIVVVNVPWYFHQRERRLEQQTVSP